MTWREKLGTAQQAAALIRPGDRVFIGTACATPRAFIHALENVENPPAGVQLIHFLTDGAVPVYSGGPYTLYQHKVFFVGQDTRPLLSSGRIDYVPISISQVHRLIDNGSIPLDVAVVQVSPPGDDGTCSLGVSVDINLAAVRRARRVIAEVNPNMPRTRGDSRIPFDRIDLAILVETPIIEYLHEPADEIAEKIARYVARIIDDGATLQVGLGRVPNEVLRHLTNRRELGIHSDVITEPILDLIESGVITGGRKSLHQGLVVASYCMGTERLYRFVDDNPLFAFFPIEYVCEPAVIAQNTRMVSMSQALAIDLTGQVCADQYGGKFYGGVSSQLDFIRGAAASEGGKSIICLSSTTDDGAGSRIRASLGEAEGVTVPRSEVHFVVTEFGIAHLFGKSIAERATALIEIAHPTFREGLLEKAKEHGYLRKEINLKSRTAYPVEEERTISLRDGTPVLLRPTRGSDVEKIQELFYRLRPEDVYTRFFTNLTSLSVPKAQHLCSVSYEDEMAIVAVAEEAGAEKAIGTGSYYLNPATNLADVAYMIEPEWQGKGLAMAMQTRLIEIARSKGLRGFNGDVLVENERMLRVFEKSGCEVTKKIVSGTYEVTMLFK